MMNKHIELVKKHLADPSSVTEEELKANWEDASYSASAAAAEAYRDGDDAAADYAYYTYSASAAAAGGYRAAASYYIKRCEELTNNKSLTDEENDDEC